MRAIPGHLHRLAQQQFDQGVTDPDLPVDYMVLMIRPSGAQQNELDQLLTDQQNPSSPSFRKWLTPEEFGGRFGLSTSDHSKVVAWLSAEGFRVERSARSRNWVAFSGTAGQVQRSLRTTLHRFRVDGRQHFANVNEPSVPDSIADVVEGFLGLNNFRLESFARLGPQFTSGGSHFLAPEDYSTIYNIAPLYKAGLDGTGQSIVVVGQSNILLTDMRSFRTRFGLPANDPRPIPYSTDPGFTDAQLEGNLDLQWAAAIAPRATVYYVYGTNAFTAAVVSIEANLAPIISISYGGCEINYSMPFYRSIFQQANAQGITILAASGDSGGASCDRQDSEPLATRGRAVLFPAVVPEVTAVGGTQFVEGTGTYWGTVNSVNGGSALSYIPETSWNESSTAGLASTGGGTSVFYSRPLWQNGAGVPSESARHIPDVSLSAAGHDAYLVIYNGALVGVSGTSASTPSLAGIVALLNQQQIANGSQKQAGLGNINPQLYRLAQVAPAVFHDITTGNNSVQCAQGTPDCITGSIGFDAIPGYDRATGLGSIDTNALFTNWNKAASPVVVKLTSNVTSATLNDTIQLTATVTAANGASVPTGSVSFLSDVLPFGTAPLDNGAATLAVPAYLLQATGNLAMFAQYSGDSVFSSGGATVSVQVRLPAAGVSAVLASAPGTVWARPADAAGQVWQTTLTVRELAGVPTLITGFAIDGQPQTLSKYFASPNLLPNGSLAVDLVFRNLAAPVTKVFVITGRDATGTPWTRRVSILFFPLPTYNFANLTATPLVVNQNPADPACQWPVQLNFDDQGGFGIYILSGLFAGSVDLTRQAPAIFGTPRLDAYAGLQGTLCFNDVAPGMSHILEADLASGYAQSVTVSFAGPRANPGKLATSPSRVALSSPSAAKPGTATLTVTMADNTHPWTASVFPANRTTSWLSLSQTSGVGTTQLTLSATGTGFEPGAYRATVTIQSPNTVPQFLSVPVIFVYGGSTSGTAITGASDAASGRPKGSPGMLLSVYGTKLANTTKTASGSPLAYTFEGITATVNGLAAPVLFASADQLNIQVPYAAGAGPSVLGINNNGEVAGFAFDLAPSAPGIFADATGNVAPTPTVKSGGVLTLFITGGGEVSPAIKTAFAPALTSTVASLPKPLLPLSVTIGGEPGVIQFAGIGAGLIGVMQINVIVPKTVALGNQPVVVSVNGVASTAANVNVQP